MALELNKNDSDGRVSIRKGQRITIRLPENPATGYRWTAANGQEGVVALVCDMYETSSDKPGAGGLHSFHFQATQLGRAIIKLIHRRPWEREESALEHFNITVDVVEQ